MARNKNLGQELPMSFKTPFGTPKTHKFKIQFIMLLQSSNKYSFVLVFVVSVVNLVLALADWFWLWPIGFGFGFKHGLILVLSLISNLKLTAFEHCSFSCFCY